MSRLDRTPAGFQIRSNTLVIMNAGGHELWRKVFTANIEPTEEMFRFHEYVSHAWIADLDGDGKQEVLVRTHYATELVSQPLICYSDAGVEKWQYNPTVTVKTRHESFPPTYQIREVEILPGSPSRIVATFSHIPNYPSQLVLLSAEGKVIRDFWHSGHLASLVVKDLNNDGKPEIYVAGVANGWKAATLLELDPENFGGASDESQAPDYQLLGFGPENIAARLIFGRTRINREFQRANSAALSSIPGGLWAEVLEYPSPRTTVNYQFGPNLSLQNVDVPDSYEICYKDLEARGLIRWKFDELQEEDDLRKSLLYLKR